MKRIVFGIIVAIFGLLALLSADQNVQGPTGSIIFGLVCIALGSTFIYFGIRSRKRLRAERIQEGLPVSPPLTPRDVFGLIIAWVCGLMFVALFGFLAQLFHLNQIGGLVGAIVNGLVFVMAIGGAIQAGKSVYGILRQKKDPSDETTQQTDAPQ